MTSLAECALQHRVCHVGVIEAERHVEGGGRRDHDPIGLHVSAFVRPSAARPLAV
jgi:hypothetical protein